MPGKMPTTGLFVEPIAGGFILSDEGITHQPLFLLTSSRSMYHKTSVASGGFRSH